jgi:hypothetical protein
MRALATSTSTFPETNEAAIGQRLDETLRATHQASPPSAD